MYTLEKPLLHSNLDMLKYKILHEEQSPYQYIKLVLTEDGLISLFLDNSIQFIEGGERDYHRILTKAPYKVQKVLVLGGGDGLAARDLLSNHCDVTLVELDPCMIDIFSEHPLCRKLNNNSLSKCKVIINDATKFIKHIKPRFYDMIISDLVDYKPGLEHLYSLELYKDIHATLKPGGIISAYDGGAKGFKMEDILFDVGFRAIKTYKIPVFKSYKEPYEFQYSLGNGHIVKGIK